MRERWIQLSAAMLCGMGACANNAPATHPATAPSTTSTTTAPSIPPVVTPHEPVPPPPPTPPPAAATRPTVVEPPGETPATALHSSSSQPMMPAATTQPGPIDDRVAYAIGYSAGRRTHDRLHEDGRTDDDLLVLKGFIDGLDDRDPAYHQGDVQAGFAEFQSYTQQRRAEKLYADNPAFRKRADENQQKSRILLDQNAEVAGVEVRPDGVQILMVNPGNGRAVGNAHMLTLKNLKVSLADGALVKAADGDKPEKIETADVLPALTDAIRGIRVGAKCRVWLPPDKAYGLTGKPPIIGPNQAIEYEFELVNAE